MEIFYEKGKKYNCIKGGRPYFRTSVTIQGKNRQVYGDGEKDALKKIEVLKELDKSGIELDKKNSKANDVMRHWLYDIKRIDKKIKGSSFSRYDTIYRTHIEPYPIMTHPLSKITSGMMQKYVTYLYEDAHLTGPTIEGAIKVWKMFARWAMDEGYIVKNPCRNLSLPGKHDNGKRVIEVFNDEERKKILDCMDTSGYCYDTVIKLAFATGMREGELLSLKWEDIEDDVIHVKRSTGVFSHIDKDGNHERRREVWDTKTKNSVRDIPILPSTQQMLKQHYHDQCLYYLAHGLGKPTYLFTTETGKMVDPSSFIKSYARLLKRAGVPYRKFHCIRHTFATEAIRRGVDVKDLQLIMGHSDIQTTYIYVQSDMNSKRRALEKMGEVI